MTNERSPLLKLDRSTVIGYLKSANTRDPDILHTQKTHLLSLAKFPKLVGTYLMVVGALTAVSFVTAVDDPVRFNRSSGVGAYFGLTPRRHQSGEVDRDGKVSKFGDALTRTYLFEAAGTLLCF